MSKIKITFKDSGNSGIAELNDEKCPINIKNLMEKLPLEVVATHAKWGGNEIWSIIKDFKNYKKENETSLPSVGEILLVPQSDGSVCFDVWYDRGWCFGPTGLQSGSAIGKITIGLDKIAKDSSAMLSAGGGEQKLFL